MNFERIFSIQSDEEFNEVALEIFHFQYKETEIYHQFVNYLQKKPTEVNHYTQIPFLPIEFFKKYPILNKNYSPNAYFQSSGTTSENLSKHYRAQDALYIESLEKGFRQFIAPPEDCIFLGLLPSYLERPNSSLLFMINHLMQISGDAHNAYFLKEEDALEQLLNDLKNSPKKIILFGVSFALLDFISTRKIENKNLIIIETGGMKGRRKEITKNEVFEQLRNGFPNAKINSEYGMTELFSQAYALDSLIYQTPNWMRILIRELDDPLEFAKLNTTGAINCIDLANLYSCSFIATQDVGKLENSTQFRVLGRIDHSDIRGCSLLLS